MRTYLCSVSKLKSAKLIKSYNYYLSWYFFSKFNTTLYGILYYIVSSSSHIKHTFSSTILIIKLTLVSNLDLRDFPLFHFVHGDFYPLAQEPGAQFEFSALGFGYHCFRIGLYGLVFDNNYVFKAGGFVTIAFFDNTFDYAAITCQKISYTALYFVKISINSVS